MLVRQHTPVSGPRWKASGPSTNPRPGPSETAAPPLIYHNAPQGARIKAERREGKTMNINGYIVTKSCTESGGLLVNVSYVKPGGRVNSPEWAKTVFIREKTRKFQDVQDSLIDYIARLPIPAGGYAKIEI